MTGDGKQETGCGLQVTVTGCGLRVTVTGCGVTGHVPGYNIRYTKFTVHVPGYGLQVTGNGQCYSGKVSKQIIPQGWYIYRN